MIFPSNACRIFLATQPIDFRKGMDGLAGYIANNFDLDPFSGAIYVFRSRRANMLKMIVWDGTGLVLVTKRLDGRGFPWPTAQSAPFTLSRVQLDALFEGTEWNRVSIAVTRKPVFL
ncbi:IS66 family insertion sequence element accessory protein TnpB [Rhodobacter sp. 24-YEA-8]|uniref:IS66 family insertion sequence element accessory protein TnpB n=1 Tax=Rhodobacter sp. 24-YEA-8 TaxID=1884310 RepID=UPI00089BF1EC|nr:IS66 family insertion sequence element accessory protein TnpB [Rhodobacter sp. 24-YEA-8]SED17363.1 transposase [Rhodobacter sp. 24-YEA-8]